MTPIPNIEIPNSLALPARATIGCTATSEDDIREALDFAHAEGLRYQVVGEGSNVVPHDRVDRFVAIMAIRGIEHLDATTLRVAAGENWHELVQYALSQGLFGLENLSLIPGSVGAAPIQNIGAYGVEIASFVERVRVMESDGTERDFEAVDCGFAYRSSVFQDRPGTTILRVDLRLSTTPRVITSYPDVQRVLAERGIENPTPHDIAEVVCDIRRSKLPNPKTDPNAGSFFKNPVVGDALAAEVKRRLPGAQVFPQADGVKLSAAQLIDACGWKEKPEKTVGCWPTQPLVLVNRGQATTADVLGFAEVIRSDVYGRFGVQLELEPSVLS